MAAKGGRLPHVTSLTVVHVTARGGPWRHVDARAVFQWLYLVIFYVVVTPCEYFLFMIVFVFFLFGSLIDNLGIRDDIHKV